MATKEWVHSTDFTVCTNDSREVREWPNREWGVCEAHDRRVFARPAKADPSQVLYVLTVGDAADILGRDIDPAEVSSMRKTLDHALADDASDAIMAHGLDQSEEEE